MHENTDITNRIWQFVQGAPDANMEAHLQTCTDCKEEFHTLSGLAALRLVNDVPPIPSHLQSTLAGLLTRVRPDLVAKSESAPSVGQRLRTIIADLLQDTAIQPQIVGLRGEIRTRQIAFTSDVADLDLEVSPSEEKFLVVGQLGMDEVPHSLNIRFVPANLDPRTAPENDTCAAQLSDQGHFRISIAPGDWVITVEIDDALVIYPGIEL